MSEIRRRAFWIRALLVLSLPAVLAATALFFKEASAANKPVTINMTECPAPTPSVSGNSASIWTGQSVNLSWNINGEVVANGSSFSQPSGSQSVSPGCCGNTTYTMRAYNRCDPTRVRESSFSVNVQNPPPPPPPPDDDDDDDDDCFLAGTKITLADGTVKNVEDVKVGDEVLSYDVASGKYVGAKAVVAMKRVSPDYFRINDGLEVTPEHQFMAGGTWKRADELKEGDTLINANGQPVVIHSLIKITQEVPVFHIEVPDPPSTYFAGNVLVHNLDKGESPEGKGMLSGTKVIMGDGRYVPIETLKAGDMVLVYDQKTGGYAIKPVVSTSRSKVKEYLLVNKSIRMGPNHPILTAKKGATKKK